jgi:mannose-6-phosphate isomerase-like protein (cupin superfamily)
MTSTPWDTQEIASTPLVTAPDGSAVRVLCATRRGGTATFSLEPGVVAKAVAHRTVEEIWYVAAGQGRLWRKHGEAEQIVDLAPGLSLTIPVGTRFQFRNDGTDALHIVAVTMPPWPGEDEAMPADGVWSATV